MLTILQLSTDAQWIGIQEGCSVPNRSSSKHNKKPLPPTKLSRASCYGRSQFNSDHHFADKMHKCPVSFPKEFSGVQIAGHRRDPHRIFCVFGFDVHKAVAHKVCTSSGPTSTKNESRNLKSWLRAVAVFRSPQINTAAPQTETGAQNFLNLKKSSALSLTDMSRMTRSQPSRKSSKIQTLTAC